MADNKLTPTEKNREQVVNKTPRDDKGNPGTPQGTKTDDKLTPAEKHTSQDTPPSQ